MLKAAESVGVGGLLPTPPLQFCPFQVSPEELIQLTTFARAAGGLITASVAAADAAADAAAEAIHRAHFRRPIRHVRLFMISLDDVESKRRKDTSRAASDKLPD